MPNTYDIKTGQIVDDTGYYDKQMPFFEDDEVKFTKELLDDYDNATRRAWAEEVVEDDDFRHNKQWSQEQIAVLIANNQSPIVINVIQQAVESAVASLTANRPRFTTTGREDSDTKTGKVFSEILTWLWDQSDGNVVFKQVVDDFYVKSMGVVEICFDPYGDFGKGELRIKSVDPLDVYIDPHSKDKFARDAAHILTVDILSKEQILEKWPDWDQIVMQAKEAQYSRKPVSTRDGGIDFEVYSEKHKRYEVVTRRSKMKVVQTRAFDQTTMKEWVFEWPDEMEAWMQSPIMLVTSFPPPQQDPMTGEIIEAQPQQRLISSGDELAMFNQMLAQFGEIIHFEIDPETGEQYPAPGPEMEGSVPGSTMQLQQVPMQMAVESEQVTLKQYWITRIKRVITVGDVLAEQTVLPISNYDIIPIMNRHRRNPYPMSDVRFVRPIQEAINKIRSLIIAHATNSTNQKLIIPRGAADKKQIAVEWGKAGTGIIEVDSDAGNFEVVSPPPLPNELYRNEIQYRQDIQEILGQYNVSQGDPQGAQKTFKGTVAMDEYGQRRIKSKLNDLEAGINHLAKTLIEWIQKVYTYPKVLRILQPNNKPREVQLNYPIYDDVTGNLQEIINDVTVGAYDVIVATGSMLPSNRWAQFEYYMQMYQAGLIDQLEVLKKTEVVDTEGVLERIDMIKNLQAQIAQLEDELAKVEGDNQTLSREIIHAQKKVEVEKFKTELNAIKNKSQAATMLYGKSLDMAVRETNTTLQAERKIAVERAKAQKKGAKK